LTAVVKQTAMVPDRPHNGAPPLDDTSKAIIAELQQDGRRAYSAIGKSVGLSEAAVRARVQRLVDKGVMDIVAVTDPLQLGFLLDVENRQIRAMDAVCGTETFVYLKLAKQTYSWGVS
jgi:Lrp/AsnC family transcriptional regulator for asnA, asnC and gidA